MKKYLFMAAALVMGLSFTACSNDDDAEIPAGTAGMDLALGDIAPSADNIATWTYYARLVANLLVSDSESLLEAWKESYDGGEAYATQFKNASTSYTSYADCVEEIITGCADIANEVGSAKIGEPRDLWESGEYVDAVLAVESWFSFHSRDDYSNNILSIRNAIKGTRDGSEATASLATWLKANESALYTELMDAITAAYDEIQAIQQPFRSYIGTAQVLVAQDACAELEDILSNKVLPVVTEIEEDVLKPIIEQYVDVVVLPTYEDLVAYNTALQSAIVSLQSNPGTTTFYAAAQAWMAARTPWETSEAFLFGPVANLGLDPNMDSWPLDLDAIKNIINNGEWDELEWEGDYDEEDEDIEAAQNVRGFHTLEFLIFKEGEARTY